MIPVVAANIWHVGVLIGTVAILIGDSTGFAWLEYPRGASVLLFAAFLLIAIFPPSPRSARGRTANFIRRTGSCWRRSLVPLDLFDGQPFPRLASSGSRRRTGRD